MFVVLFEDSAAILGLIVAGLGIYLSQITGNLYFDGIASIIIGLILGGTAIWLAYETKGLLIGESADITLVEEIRKILKSQAVVEHVNEILTMHMGPQFILVNLSVDFIDAASAAEIELAVVRIDRLIKNFAPAVKRIFIEGEARRKKYDKDEKLLQG